MAEALPLVPTIPSYRIGTVIDGRGYVLDVRWNSRSRAYYFDILDEDGTPIRRGIKLMLGAALGRGCVDPLFPAGLLLASDLAGTDIDATLDDLGTRVAVFYYSIADILAGLA